MKLCVLTCTGGRPELFKLCRLWLERQTRQPDAWLVTTDVDGGVDVPEGTLRYRVEVPKRKWETVTQRAHYSLATAVLQVPADHHVVIMEDDDYYPPNYLQVMLDMLETSNGQLVGCGEERRYHVPARRWTMGAPRKRPNAGCTGIHAHHTKRYSEILYGSHGSDNEAWEQMTGNLQMEAIRTAIKGAGDGLPGRGGATKKHKIEYTKQRGWAQDPTGDQLVRWIGAENAKLYFDLVTK